MSDHCTKVHADQLLCCQEVTTGQKKLVSLRQTDQLETNWSARDELVSSRQTGQLETNWSAGDKLVSSRQTGQLETNWSARDKLDGVMECSLKDNHNSVVCGGKDLWQASVLGLERNSEN